jgi:hypothetical protein
MILTKEMLLAARSSMGGYTNKQLALIGLKLPMVDTWKRDMIGKDFPEEALNEFVALKDAHLTPEKIVKLKAQREARKVKRRAEREAGLRH